MSKNKIFLPNLERKFLSKVSGMVMLEAFFWKIEI